MRPFWTPLSALIVTDPPSFATPALLRLLTRGGRSVELLYAGDRMWPAVPHAGRVVVDPPPGAGAVTEGTVVVACPSGFPDLFRVEENEGGRLLLGADADPAPPVAGSADRILGIARLPRLRIAPATRRARRVALDLREAIHGRPDPEADPAATVLAKYDAQAPFYAGGTGGEMPGPLLRWVLESVPPGGGLFVAGSGAGHECFALAKSGRPVTGIDFSPAMVEAAKAESLRRGLDVEFLLGDLRACRRAAGTLAAIFFTYDVYSFVPVRAARVALLREMARWLRPGGAIFVSARRFERAWDPLILTLQRTARRGGGEWGESHTRWIAPDGTLRRSFVRVFTSRAFRGEARDAGLWTVEWRANHCLLRPAARTSP